MNAYHCNLHGMTTYMHWCESAVELHERYMQDPDYKRAYESEAREDDARREARDRYRPNVMIGSARR